MIRELLQLTVCFLVGYFIADIQIRLMKKWEDIRVERKHKRRLKEFKEAIDILRRRKRR